MYCIHVITDGRDTDPHSSPEYITQVLSWSEYNHISSIIGRYYAMDRDNRMERVKDAYELFVHGKGQFYSQDDILVALQESYDNGYSDEFIKPIKFGGRYYGII